MKFLYIKIGKILSSIHNDGFLATWRRVVYGMWEIVRPIGKGDILLISGGSGESSRYRTRHIKDFLEHKGLRAKTVLQGNIFLSFLSKDFKVFIFHRVFWNEKVKVFIQKKKDESKTIIFETDDLVFDSSLFKKTDAYTSLHFLEKDLYKEAMGKEFLEDTSVRVATTTTKFLQEKLESKGKKVFIVPNMLSRKDIIWCDRILSSKEKGDWEKNEGIVLGYFSGTKSHKRDFALLTKTLVRIFTKYPDVSLLIAGPLLLEETLKPFSDKIIRIPFSERKSHFLHIASVDINLAPLEIGDDFCEAKSELKFIEAGVVGIPTIASATRTFQLAIEQGIDGFFAQNEDEWYTFLSKLIEDQDLRRRMGYKARKKVLKRYITEADVSKEYVHFLKKNVVKK
ncbi:MAG: glycosyltransferase family 1 protein [Candidatus Moranbacteria bacterium]|nr:glycosyltransferase family 1 protein [Candidatus Moranbacteria bacterium]